MRLCPVCTAATWIVFPSVSLSLSLTLFFIAHEATQERYSILFGLCLIPMYFSLLFDVKHMCLKAQGRSCLWLFFLQCIFLITICRFLAVLSSLRRQISQVCSRFAWWAFNTLLLLTFFVLIIISLWYYAVKNRGIFSGFWHGCCSVVRVWCPISVTDMTPQIIRLVQECVLLFFLSNGIIKQEHHRQ